MSDKKEIVELPKTFEELTYWKINNRGQNLNCDRVKYVDAWDWIKSYGVPLFYECMEFIIEVDAGLGFSTHVFKFDDNVILIGEYNQCEYNIYDLKRMFTSLEYSELLV